MNKILLGSIAAFILAFTGLVVTFQYHVAKDEVIPVFGGVSQGTEGSIATSTTLDAPSRTAFTASSGRTATSSACSSRTISTGGAGIRLSFATTTPFNGTPYFQVTTSVTAGHIQAASTTVVYDSQFWGCGAIQIWSDAAQVITIGETQ